jgi:hypothetical protein
MILVKYKFLAMHCASICQIQFFHIRPGLSQTHILQKSYDIGYVTYHSFTLKGQPKKNIILQKSY